MDNDAKATFKDGSPAPNWGQEAAYKFALKYSKLGYETSVETPVNKDVNQDLCVRKCIIQEEQNLWIGQEDSLEL